MAEERFEAGIEPADRAESWPVEASSDLYRDAWVMALRRDTLHRPGAEDDRFGRLVFEHPGAAVVLAIDDHDRVLVLRQYRHPARHRFVELPAGLLDGDADEEPLEVARRELQEEAGYAAERWQPLVSAYSSPGISEEQIHYFLARGLTWVGHGDFVLRHEEADMERGWVPFAELLDAVLDGRIGDGPVLIAVLAYDALRRRSEI